jgi:hypothetical protein
LCGFARSFSIAEREISLQARHLHGATSNVFASMRSAMRMRHEIILLLAILFGIAGGGVAYYFWQNVWLCLASAVGAIITTVVLLSWAASTA